MHGLVFGLPGNQPTAHIPEAKPFKRQFQSSPSWITVRICSWLKPAGNCQGRKPARCLMASIDWYTSAVGPTRFIGSFREIQYYSAYRMSGNTRAVVLTLLLITFGSTIL